MKKFWNALRFFCDIFGHFGIFCVLLFEVSEFLGLCRVLCRPIETFWIYLDFDENRKKNIIMFFVKEFRMLCHFIVIFPDFSGYFMFHILGFLGLFGVLRGLFGIIRYVLVIFCGFLVFLLVLRDSLELSRF